MDWQRVKNTMQDVFTSPNSTWAPSTSQATESVLGTMIGAGLTVLGEASNRGFSPVTPTISHNHATAPYPNATSTPQATGSGQFTLGNAIKEAGIITIAFAALNFTARRVARAGWRAGVDMWDQMRGQGSRYLQPTPRAPAEGDIELADRSAQANGNAPAEEGGAPVNPQTVADDLAQPPQAVTHRGRWQGPASPGVQIPRAHSSSR